MLLPEIRSVRCAKEWVALGIGTKLGFGWHRFRPYCGHVGHTGSSFGMNVCFGIGQNKLFRLEPNFGELTIRPLQEPGLNRPYLKREFPSKGLFE